MIERPVQPSSTEEIRNDIEEERLDEEELESVEEKGGASLSCGGLSRTHGRRRRRYVGLTLKMSALEV